MCGVIATVGLCGNLETQLASKTTKMQKKDQAT